MRKIDTGAIANVNNDWQQKQISICGEHYLLHICNI